jgi:cysteine desulfurase
MYWDYTATTKPKDAVITAMMPYLQRQWLNPSSIYESAKEVKREIEKVREKVARFINADPDEIYFTSGGSESNSWVFNGFYKMCEWGQICTTKIEHHSIQDAIKWLNKCYYEFEPVDKLGRVRPVFLPNDDFISIQMANNEIGTVQDIKKLVQEARAENPKVLFHTDAVQAFGKIPIDVKDLDVDYLSASGHKIGTPKGIGFLYMRRGKELAPMIYGTQERGYRGGTENVPYIIGLGRAVDIIDYNNDKLKSTYEYAHTKLQNIASFNGDPQNRLWGIMSATIKANIDGDMLLNMLHERGQMVSAGSACNAYNAEPSQVLKAIGLTDEEAKKTIRISFSESINTDEIDWLVKDINECIDFLKMMEI